MTLEDILDSALLEELFLLGTGIVTSDVWVQRNPPAAN
eukprot:CAMPEP_0168766344 /NCGR_PEP_ID=MMETSP0725-20121227/790_1 /TAXON_ID=265536 /ORGANISM="Amphiprora sp., Strain CCMP467" /LENGTH=37 /DNA_ID= /DNA_START= /DNA_END= /DNA_ORIENTATION=